MMLLKRLINFADRLQRPYRVLVSIAIALIVFLLTISRHPGATVFMLCWISFGFSMLFFSWVTILSKHPKDIGTVANMQDTSYVIIFLIVVMAAFFSLFAIIILLKNLPSESRSGLNAHILFSIASVTCSWLLIHSLFTIRYAHLFYTYKSREAKQHGKHDGGLVFPETPDPDFLDFAYFSFVLGMTFQVADVNITGSKIRRLALVHGFLAFVYNTAIIALSINIISGIIGK